MSAEMHERVRQEFKRNGGHLFAIDVDALIEEAVVQARAGHHENCDVFQRAPDMGPSQKPCNCRGVPR